MRLIEQEMTQYIGAQNGGAGHPLKVAVIGSGISGLGAAYALSRGGSAVTVFEKDSRIGGHANTVHAALPDGDITVDTGFIVYNEANYQNLIGLFAELGVETAASDMSFSASFDDGKFEYSGSGLGGLFSRRRNAVSPKFWAMLRDLIRFYRTAPALLADMKDADITLGEFLNRHGFGKAFRELHLLPMAAAIWSSPMVAMEDYPVKTFVRFFTNHGLLSLGQRPAWRTVKTGSRQYVDKLVAAMDADIRLRANISHVLRGQGGVTVHMADGSAERFDHVVFACHAPDALRLMSNPTSEECEVLGAFEVHPNEVVLHTDASFMPRRKLTWTSWNYIGRGASHENGLPCLTYWMNNLQPLATKHDVFVTLNPDGPVDESKVLQRFSYNHPAFDQPAIDAQQRMPALQGQGNVWFAGAWMAYGFHEDGLESGLAVGEAIAGWQRPWVTDSAKSRVPAVPLAYYAAEPQPALHAAE